MPPLRVAVIGAGAFGRNHLRVYREIELAHPNLVQLSALVEPDADRRNAFAATFNIPAFSTVAELLAAHHPLDAASICVPTIHHASVAEQLLLAGIDILIEKPFATTLTEADRVLDLARTHRRIVAIGHLERFNPAVAATIAALNQPMFFEAHRLSVFTPRSLDVDVVLDLMIHDLDIVLSLTQSPIREVRAVGLPILSRKTDIANVRVEFDSGCVANFTASRVSTEQVRKLRLFQPHQYLSLDFARQELLTISVDPTLIAAAISTPQNLSSRPKSAHFAAFPNLSSRPEASALSSLGDLTPHSAAPTLNLSSRPEASALSSLGALTPHSAAPTLNLSSRPEASALSSLGALAPHSAAPTLNLSSRPEASALSSLGALAPHSAAPTQNLSSRPEAAHFAAAVERPASPPTEPTEPDGSTHETPSPAPIPAAHPTAGLNLTRADVPKGEPLRLELEDFLHAVRNRTQPRVPAEAGRAALSLALTINEQIAAHARQSGLL